MTVTSVWSWPPPVHTLAPLVSSQSPGPEPEPRYNTRHLGGTASDKTRVPVILHLVHPLVSHTLPLCHRWCSSPQHRTRKLTISDLEGNEECSRNYTYFTKENPLYISNKSSQIYQQLICNCFLYLYV